jgi:hypothetical protein
MRRAIYILIEYRAPVLATAAVSAWSIKVYFSMEVFMNKSIVFFLTLLVFCSYDYSEAAGVIKYQSDSEVTLHTRSAARQKLRALRKRLDEQMKIREREREDWVQAPVYDKESDIDKDGNTVLHVVARDGNAKIVQFLLENNVADVNAKNNFGQTALDLAKLNGLTDVIEVFAGLAKFVDEN